MGLRPLSTAHRWAALILLGGCSLRSLDYLEREAKETSSQAGTGGVAGLASGGSGAGPSTGGSAPGEEAGSPPVGTDGGDTGTSTGGSTSPTAGTGGVQPSPPDCTDSLTTSDETDVDCGGRTCTPCETDQSCLTGTDCKSAICTNQVCQAPTCTDLAINGDETDKNCGGSCVPCAQGFHCGADDDCATGKCEQGICVSTTCSDDVLTKGCPLLVDNTAYAFSPAHSLTRCLDDNALSVAEGARIVLWSCKTELQQTFWAVDQMDGYFALRSALSGKCLQVRDASSADGAVVEQGTCNASASQLWKPERVDSTFMQLTSKKTGFFLDVAGANVSSDGQLIVQSEAGESADTRWRAVKRNAAAYVAFSPYKDKTLRARHRASRVALSDVDDHASHFKVVPGLSNPSLVSFQSRDEPGRYLRHASFKVWTDSNDGSTQFKKDATFRFASPFVGTEAQVKALEASNYAGMFITRDGTSLTLSSSENNDTYKNDATWWLVGR